jgi:hypothetical protein
MKSFPKRRLALRPESACTLPVPPMTAYESVNKPYPPKQGRDGYSYPSFRIRHHDLPKQNTASLFMQCHASDCNSRVSGLGMHAKSDRSLLQRHFQCPSDHTPPTYPSSPQTP